MFMPMVIYNHVNLILLSRKHCHGKRKAIPVNVKYMFISRGIGHLFSRMATDTNRNRILFFL